MEKEILKQEGTFEDTFTSVLSCLKLRTLNDVKMTEKVFDFMQLCWLLAENSQANDNTNDTAH